MGVRVEITALGVVVAEADPATKSDIGCNVGHALVVEGSLEFRRHEAVTVTRVDQAEEVDRKHADIEANWDNDQAEETGKEVFEPQALSHVSIQKAAHSLVVNAPE